MIVPRPTAAGSTASVAVRTTVPPSTPPTDAPLSSIPTNGSTGTGRNAFETVAEVVRTVVRNLGDNGYQTGVALVVATVATVAMINIKVHRAIMVPVAIGAFWAGWLGWNTVTGKKNSLFPGEVSAITLWDVAFRSDTGFLLAVGVACIAAVLLWRTGLALVSRVLLIVGAVLGTSFAYNLFEAARATSKS